MSRLINRVNLTLGDELRDAKKIWAILVVYNAEYLERSIEVFLKIREYLGGNVSIIIVSNNPDITIESSKDYVVISGTNRNSEFGAWQEGIGYLQERNRLEDCSGMLLANDTFCTHRKFTIVDVLFFGLMARLCKILSVAACVGELSQTRLSFNLHGLKTSRWISTYIYFMNKPLINGLSFTVAGSDMDVKISTETNRIFTNIVDHSLGLYIENFVTGKSGGARWYKAENKSSENISILRRKSYQILQEKELYHRMRTLDAFFWNYRTNIVRRFLNRIERAIKSK